VSTFEIQTVRRRPSNFRIDAWHAEDSHARCEGAAVTDKSDNHPAGIDEPSRQDWFLQSIVSMVNGTDLEIGIILAVNGILISGNLVSGHWYFEGVNSDLVRAFRDRDKVTHIEPLYRRYGYIYPTPVFEEDSQLPPTYIHLKNARFFHGTGTPLSHESGVWWRGRICEVDGFTLGSLSEESPE